MFLTPHGESIIKLSCLGAIIPISLSALQVYILGKGVVRHNLTFFVLQIWIIGFLCSIKISGIGLSTDI